MEIGCKQNKPLMGLVNLVQHLPSSGYLQTALEIQIRVGEPLDLPIFEC